METNKIYSKMEIVAEYIADLDNPQILYEAILPATEEVAEGYFINTEEDCQEFDNIEQALYFMEEHPNYFLYAVINERGKNITKCINLLD